MRLQWPRFLLKPEPDRAQDPCTARIDSTRDLNVLKAELGNRKIMDRISGNNTEKEYSTQQCPGGIKLDIGHSEHKQGKYNSAYSIGFVVYTCLRLNAMICYKVCYVMCYDMLGYVVNNLLGTDDARWKGEAWRTVKCGDQAATRFEFLYFKTHSGSTFPTLHSPPSLASPSCINHG
ncbi:hypothetical protein TIFTF001_025896 [Ficus carica]|uniref:Uncharacterized protein n=1 Tax=Ficus carica TaxID=3494 RepID=A0AA88AKN3_FICCA|nr:hypothetical protein TIFTF001_025896 [Ficus carica]